MFLVIATGFLVHDALGRVSSIALGALQNPCHVEYHSKEASWNSPNLQFQRTNTGDGLA